MYYSQYGEDKFLNDNFFKNKKNGRYIELGALDGTLFSNTKFFQDTLNWTGILIEPHKEKYNNLINNRKNNYIFNELVSCENKPLKFQYINNIEAVSSIISTQPISHNGNNGWFKKYNSNTVTMTPKSLTEIIKKTPYNHFHLLSLDVEGHELEVLKSLDFNTIKVDVILMEALDGSENDNNRVKKCRELLLNNSYEFIIREKHNEIFIHKSCITNYL